MTPFDIWAPIFRAPFSGNVTQEISPRLLSPNIQGVPEIEHKIETEVASFGKQLGKIIEALRELSKETNVPLADIDDLYHKIEAAKAESKDALRVHAMEALARLKAADAEGWSALVTEAGSEGPPET
ncbi:MAG: hypothetical protein AAFQ64_04995 [Pseudomonadota bacterium]